MVPLQIWGEGWGTQLQQQQPDYLAQPQFTVRQVYLFKYIQVPIFERRQTKFKEDFPLYELNYQNKAKYHLRCSEHKTYLESERID